MSSEFITWMWLIGGLALISAELAWPHFYSAFFGLAAILVALLRAIGLLHSAAQCFIVWFLASMVLLVTLRHLAVRFLHSESSYQLTDEDVEAVGEIVEVIVTVSDRDENGRVRFRGTTWPAISREGTILPGQKAKILYRDNLVWKVEPYFDSEEGNEKSPIPAVEKGRSSG